MSEIVTITMRRASSDTEIVRTHVVGVAMTHWKFDRPTAYELLNTILTAMSDSNENIDVRMQSRRNSDNMHQLWFAITDYEEQDMCLDVWRGDPGKPFPEQFSSRVLESLFTGWVFEFERGVVLPSPKVDGTPATLMVNGASYVRVDQP